MSAKVLGRVVTSQDRPRGPDVQMSVGVPAGWIADGATLRVELPRNLACAACRGGGCDACGRAGAVSLRGRADPAETVEVTLPKGPAEGAAAVPPAIAVRIPDRGGLPPEGSELPRGNLMLGVHQADAADACVTRLSGPSVPPPDHTEFVESEAPPTEQPRVLWLLVAAVVSALLAWVLGH